MTDGLEDTLQAYSRTDLNQRKRWYSPSAAAYNEARPDYPDRLIHAVVNAARLSSPSTLLEVGCGPGTATMPFARLGHTMHCLEPNPDFYELAQHNCRLFQHVHFQQTSFEEWPLERSAFDVVLAASSFHWIPSEVGYPKAAKALKQNGHLILLWNKELQPSYGVYQYLEPVYNVYVPHLNRFETKDAQLAIINQLGQHVLRSGYFEDLAEGHVDVEVTYSISKYLDLLSTYSPYLKLEETIRDSLFRELKMILEQQCGDKVRLFGVSAFHVARKCQR